VPAGQALLRSGARAGDALWASGTVGDARLALEMFRGTLQLPADVFAAARDRLEQPTPRVSLGIALRGLATSAIDISDGLAGDLGHVLQASGVGARIEQAAALSLLAAPAAALPDEAQRLDAVLAGGDDYELLFTAPDSATAAVQAAGVGCGVRVTRIGTIEAEAGLRVVDAGGRVLPRSFRSFDHFA
jgi:thiamine-monophosphate kinase